MDEGRRKRTAGGIDICKRLFLPRLPVVTEDQGLTQLASLTIYRANHLGIVFVFLLVTLTALVIEDRKVVHQIGRVSKRCSPLEVVICRIVRMPQAKDVSDFQTSPHYYQPRRCQHLLDEPYLGNAGKLVMPKKADGIEGLCTQFRTEGTNSNNAQ